MLKKFFATTLYAACALSLASCGGAKSAGSGEFATVYASVSGPGSNINSDVATWGSAAAVCSAEGPTFTDDSAVYTFTSTAYDSADTGQTSTIQASNLQVKGVTMTLTPATPSVQADGTLIDTPALPAALQTQYGSAGQLIVPGAATPVTVTFDTHQLKAFLFGHNINCSNPVLLSYWAVVSFRVQEVNTGKEKTMTADPIKVNFADFPDSSSS
jgi:hypothetical protein